MRRPMTDLEVCTAKITCVGAALSAAAALKLLMGSSSGTIMFFTLVKAPTSVDLTGAMALPMPPPMPSQSGRQMPASRAPTTSRAITMGRSTPPRRRSGS